MAREPTKLRILRTATYLLMNYVALVPGVPTRMHFTDDYYVDREIADRETGKPKRIKSLVFWVDELNGEDVAPDLPGELGSSSSDYSPAKPLLDVGCGYCHVEVISCSSGIPCPVLGRCLSSLGKLRCRSTGIIGPLSSGCVYRFNFKSHFFTPFILLSNY